MSFNKYHNITGSTGVTVELISPGSIPSVIKSILITNIHETADATITLFIEDSPVGVAASTFKLISTIAIPSDTSLLLDESSMLSFNTPLKWGLYITVGSSDTVDVFINA
jgi:hypothetical protein